MTPSEEYEYHLERANRFAAERDAAWRRLVRGLWWLFSWAAFSLAAAWGYAYFGLGCRGWACLLPLGG